MPGAVQPSASVIAMRDAIAPAAVGVDIGCGMAAIETSLKANDLPDNLSRLRVAIERAIPVGKAAHREAAWEQGSTALRNEGKVMMEGYRNLEAPIKGLGEKVACQVGTLGGGNHFIEVCLDTKGHRLVDVALRKPTHRCGSGGTPYRGGASPGSQSGAARSRSGRVSRQHAGLHPLPSRSILGPGIRPFQIDR